MLARPVWRKSKLHAHRWVPAYPDEELGRPGEPPNVGMGGSSSAGMGAASSVVGAAAASSSVCAESSGLGSSVMLDTHKTRTRTRTRTRTEQTAPPASLWEPIIEKDVSGKVKWPDLPNAKARKKFRERVRKWEFNQSKIRGDAKWTKPRFSKELAPPPICNRCGVLWKHEPKVLVCVQINFLCLCP